MKIIIDILHPAHVHFFKFFIKIMEKEGHEILITARDKEITLELLDQFKISYKLISRQKKGIRLGVELISRTLKLLNIANKFKPDCFMGIMGPSISIVGYLIRKPAYIFYDTEHAKITNIFTFNLAKKVITPNCYWDNLGPKHVRYNGYQELTYLHRNHYRPERDFLKRYGLENEKIFILRFVSWDASHDIGHKGLSYELKTKLVSLLSKKGRLIISSEGKLPPEFEKYKINIPLTKIHDLLYFSEIYIGEGATMASEAAVLGTFAIYINTLSLGYINDQEKAGLVKHFNPNKWDNNGYEVISYVDNLLKHKSLKKEVVHLKENLLRNKVDVSKWTKEFIINESIG